MPGEWIVALTNGGYLKRMPLSEFNTQKRGGKGVTGTKVEEGDSVKLMSVADAADHVLFFTEGGLCHHLRGDEVPEFSRYAKGKMVDKVLELGGDSISCILAVKNLDVPGDLFFATQGGFVKKTDLASFRRPKSGGLRAMGIRDGDKLKSVVPCGDATEFVLASRNGKAIRFAADSVRAMGRDALGVTGIKLADGDQVAGAAAVGEAHGILTVADAGYGKRTKIGDYRRTSRGTQGVSGMKLSEKTGQITDLLGVSEMDEVLLYSHLGKAIRVAVNDIRFTGRVSAGVRAMRLDTSDKLAGCCKL
jgi:DNA gyrase subunit A